MKTPMEYLPALTLLDERTRDRARLLATLRHHYSQGTLSRHDARDLIYNAGSLSVSHGKLLREAGLYLLGASEYLVDMHDDDDAARARAAAGHAALTRHARLLLDAAELVADPALEVRVRRDLRVVLRREVSRG